MSFLSQRRVLYPLKSLHRNVGVMQGRLPHFPFRSVLPAWRLLKQILWL